MSGILIGISGSIAAYKACELVRRLRDRGESVRVILSPGGEQFVSAMTLQALSGHPVRHSLFDTEAESAMSHIELARFAKCFCIAPASANAIARLALGLADDLLGTVALATNAPLILAPAMNQQMWQQPIVQEHLNTLKARGVIIIPPGDGAQACGEVGPGRMAEVEDILAALYPSTHWKNKRVLITAGPTQEYVDAVRYLSNPSSGKMGYALAQAAALAGAHVDLVSGPVPLPTPSGVHKHEVVSTKDMLAMVEHLANRADMLIGAAAVADYHVECPLTGKPPKQDKLHLELIPNPDIIAKIASRSTQRPICIGFAAEYGGDCLVGAKDKCQRKALDAILVNNVADTHIGFHVEENALTYLDKEGAAVDFEKQSKTSLAREIIHFLGERFYAKSHTS